MPIFFYAKRPQGFLDVPVEQASARTLEEVLTKPEEIVGKLDASERWDFYYGVAQVSEHRRGDPKDPATGKVPKGMQGSWAKENWKRQEVLLWDLDSISEEDRGKVEAYQEIIARVLKVEPEHMTIVSSGHGFHFILFLKEPITDWKFFAKNRVFYRAILDLIETGLRGAGLTGKADPAVFDHNRVMRMPLTENRKRAPHQLAKVLQTSVHKHTLNLQALSGMPLIAEGDVLETESFAHRRLDVAGIQEECVVLRWTKEKPETVKEPLGYAALSVLGRLDKNKAIAKQYYAKWTGSTSLMQADPERKIEQALEASGPATCARFSNLSEGCKECKWVGKITSPILIQGENFVETEEDGFWREHMTNGRVVQTPAYDDMLKVYRREKHYFLQPETDLVWFWNGRFYEKAFDAQLRHWCEEKTSPQLKNAQRMEFLSKLRSNYLLSEKEFEAYRERTVGLLNLGNGVLDTKTLVLHPPDPSRGFKYGIDYNYVPGATCPKFDAFLSTVMRDDPDLIKAMWDAFAACLWSGYKGLDASFWMFAGAGSNGKTSLLSIIVAALGGISNCIYLKPKHFKSDERFALSRLEGKLLCVIEEVNEGHLGDDFLGMIKDMTDGGTIAVEGKGVDHWQMKNTAKIIMTTNKSLVLQDTTGGLQRRMILAPFEENFEDPKWKGKKDPDIVSKILPELPGILNRGLEALQGLQANGGFPHHPSLSKTEMDQMVMNSDSVERWAKEHIIVTNDVDDYIDSKEAYAAYKEWLGDDSAKTSRITFSARIRKKTYAAIRARNPEKRVPGGKQLTVIWGVKKSQDSDAKF